MADRTLLLSVAGVSALIGGLTGAFASSLLAPPARDDARARTSHDPVEDKTSPQVSARLDALERSVRALELRRFIERPTSAAAPSDSEAKDSEAKDTPLVDDPVFEAAVLDVLARAERGRASEREARREENKRLRVEQWGAQLTRELTLQPDQLSAILKLRDDLAKALDERGAPGAAGELSRRARREHRDTLRSEAEAKLRALLNPRQAAAYDQLDADLKLGRAAR